MQINSILFFYSSILNEKSQRVRKAIKVFLVRRVSPSPKAKVPLQALAMKIESTLQEKTKVNEIETKSH